MLKNREKLLVIKVLPKAHGPSGVADLCFHPECLVQTIHFQ